MNHLYNNDKMDLFIYFVFDMIFLKISIKNDTKVHIKFRTLAKIIYHERAMIYLCVDTKLDNKSSAWEIRMSAYQA